MSVFSLYFRPNLLPGKFGTRSYLFCKKKLRNTVQNRHFKVTRPAQPCHDHGGKLVRDGVLTTHLLCPRPRVIVARPPWCHLVPAPRHLRARHPSTNQRRQSAPRPTERAGTSRIACLRPAVVKGTWSAFAWLFHTRGKARGRGARTCSRTPDDPE